MYLSDFFYELPKELVARYPLKGRSESRLLCLQGKEMVHRQFKDLVQLIQPGDLLICNNSRVIPARLFGKKASGGAVEILVERILDSYRCLAQVRASKSPQPGSVIFLKNNISLLVAKRQENLFELHAEKTEKNILDVIEAIGEVPIPPYFERSAEEMDKERYQTVFAATKGSVAAPTAGLHFDEMLLNQLTAKGIEIDYVTLHVGAGTFTPVRKENICEHVMHAEYIAVSASVCEKVRATKARGGRVIAVGTTSVRSLETASQKGMIEPFSGDTNIFIYPGYQFKCVDALITNFHLPQSTLLMLVAAFGGYENVMRAYREAIEKQYRFYSYGDAMFLG